MKEKTIVIATLIVLAITATAAAVGYAALPQASGRIELSVAEFDFGSIPNTGPVSHTFQVRNSGDGPLKILGVSTSCGCTTARLVGRELAPGQTTDLIVTYDPLVHGGATGKFMRIVYIRSDDPDTPEATLTIQVTVVQP